MFNTPQSQIRVERTLLESALVDLRSPAPRRFLSSGFVYACLAAAGLVAAVASGVLINFVQLPPLFSKILAAFGPLLSLGLGMFLMYALLRASSKVQFFFLRPYVDRSAIESRLQRLGTRSGEA
jgi:hypothetical protein